MRLQLPVAGGLHSHGTASQLGKDIKLRATKRVLVRVTAAGSALAHTWLKEAGDAGAVFKAATAPQSRLPERGQNGALDVQTVFSKFIAATAYSQGPFARAVDTHDGCSVCGDSFKPDCVIGMGSDEPLPISTVAVVDLKRQDTPYNTNANIYQVRASLHLQPLHLLAMATANVSL